MKSFRNVLMAVTMIGFSGSAFATSVQDALKTAHGDDQKCYMEAFMATNPSAEQRAGAHKVHMDVKAVYDANKAAITAAADAMKAAMASHPIAKDVAQAAVHNLVKAAHPVQTAMFSGGIDVINSLTADQRLLFDAKLKECNQD